MELFSEESLRKAIFHAKEGGSRWPQVGSLQEGRPSVRPSSKLGSTPIVPAAYVRVRTTSRVGRKCAPGCVSQRARFMSAWLADQKSSPPLDQLHNMFSVPQCERQ